MLEDSETGKEIEEFFRTASEMDIDNLCEELETKYRIMNEVATTCFINR